MDREIFDWLEHYAQIYGAQQYAVQLNQYRWRDARANPPIPGEIVLCYFRYEPDSPDVICDNTYYGSGCWMSEGDKVTHWMPRPEAPKEF